jgi:hypothetical protein
MISRLPSFLKKALLATALVSAGHVYAADSVGIVVYNAQHEGLTKAWVEGFTQETGIPSPCVTVMTPRWAIRSCRKAPRRQPMCS